MIIQLKYEKRLPYTLNLNKSFYIKRLKLTSYISTNSKYYKANNKPPKVITPIFPNIMFVVYKVPLVMAMFFEIVT